MLRDTVTSSVVSLMGNYRTGNNEFPWCSWKPKVGFGLEFFSGSNISRLEKYLYRLHLEPMDRVGRVAHGSLFRVRCLSFRGASLHIPRSDAVITTTTPRLLLLMFGAFGIFDQVINGYHDYLSSSALFLQSLSSLITRLMLSPVWRSLEYPARAPAAALNESLMFGAPTHIHGSSIVTSSKDCIGGDCNTVFSSSALLIQSSVIALDMLCGLRWLQPIDVGVSRGGVSSDSTGSSHHPSLAKLPITEQRTANFYGAAENLRLDFETIFFSDPKFFELENFLSSTSTGWGIGGAISQFAVRCSVFWSFGGWMLADGLSMSYFASHPR